MGEIQNLKERALDAVAAFCERIGMTLLERKWSAGKDHVDLIAFDEGDLVLCDVFTRKTMKAQVNITPSLTKQTSLVRVAKAYIEEQQLIEDITVRYDIMTIIVLGEDRALLRHHRGAVMVQEPTSFADSTPERGLPC